MKQQTPERTKRLAVVAPPPPPPHPPPPPPPKAPARCCGTSRNSGYGAADY